MEVKVVEHRPNGIDFIEIVNDGMRVILSNLGCHIQSVYTRDRHGVMEDILLGYEDIEDCRRDGTYMGAIVGRVGNRIGKGRFTLNGVEYKLAVNNGPNHLHGGLEGFDRKIFDYTLLKDGVEFRYLSPDGEEGYPGNLSLKVTYRVVEDELQMIYDATSDKDTLCNITNHAYFNLSAGKEMIHDHLLTIAADKVGKIDADALATGDYLDVEGTPFDFRTPKTLGQDLNDDHEQMKKGSGYDHSFFFNRTSEQVDLYHEASGRGLVLSTSMPAMQLYTGNFLADGANGKQGRPYENRAGLALETQFMPDSINYEEDPQMVLRKDETFHAMTSLKFYTR